MRFDNGRMCGIVKESKRAGCGAFCFLAPSNSQANTFVGKAPPFGRDTRPAVRLDTDGTTGRGRFA